MQTQSQQGPMKKEITQTRKSGQTGPTHNFAALTPFQTLPLHPFAPFSSYLSPKPSFFGLTAFVRGLAPLSSVSAHQIVVKQSVYCLVWLPLPLVRLKRAAPTVVWNTRPASAGRRV